MTYGIAITSGRNHIMTARILRLVFISLSLCLSGLGVPGAVAQTTAVVTVTPATNNVPITGTRQLAVTVTGVANTAVTWSVNGIAGGNSTIGTVSATGLYTAPTAILSTGLPVSVTATSVAAPTASGTCLMTVRNLIPKPAAVSPNPVPPDAFTLTMTGNNFITGARVYLATAVKPGSGTGDTSGQIPANARALTTVVNSMLQMTVSGSATIAELTGASLIVSNPGPLAVSAPFSIAPKSGVAISVAPVAVTVALGGTQQFQAAVTGTTNLAVTWKINGLVGGSADVGTISAAGIFTAPNAVPTAGNVTIQAVAAADPAAVATATVTLLDPQAVKFGRFLEQTSTGPTAQSLAEVRQLGIPAYLAKQFTLPASPWPDGNTASPQQTASTFLYNLAAGPDQLRQRMIYALSQIFVISFNKNTYANVMIPWLEILSRNAFGNFRTLLRDLTVSQSMGLYLDLGNSNKPTPGSGANENYAREVMQLFTIGLEELNPDGSARLDLVGKPIPTYSQANVMSLALALTGWTYATPPGSTPRANNPAVYGVGEMEYRDGNHDLTEKRLLNGFILSSNQTTVVDLNGALDNLFNHPNVGPFIATRLIRSFVTSNPSAGYIQRGAAVFDNDGTGTRGNLQALLTAILLDTEARNDNSADVTQGKLRSPVLHTLGLMRSLNIPLAVTNTIASVYVGMGEAVLSAPSVFGHYSPLFQMSVPPVTNAGGSALTKLFAPEFQIYTPAEAINRANWIYQVLYAADLTAFTSVASDPVLLVNAVDRTLLFGRMTAGMRDTLTTAARATPDLRTRALTVLYLTAMDGEHLVQR